VIVRFGRIGVEGVDAAAEVDRSSTTGIVLVVPADRLVEFLERADVVVVEQGPLQSFPEIVCLLVRGFDPLGSPVDGKDDLGGDATVFEGELRHVLEVILLEVSIPDRPADVFDEPVARDDQGQFTESIGLDDCLAWIGDPVAV